MNSSGNASVSFKLRFTSILWGSVLTLQLALENGTFLGSHGVFDEAGCSGGNNCKSMYNFINGSCQIRALSLRARAS